MRKTKIPARLPKPTPPDQAAREYYRHLRQYAEKYISLMKYVLPDAIKDLKNTAYNESIEKPTRVDSAHRVSRMDTNIEKRIGNLFDWVERELNSAFSDQLLRAWSKAMINNTNKISKTNIKKVTESVGLDVEPLLHDRDLNPYFQNVVDENVGLIKSIPTMHQTAFKNALVFAITNDMPRDQIEKIIMKHIGKKGNVKARANLISVDQVGKMNASLNEYRQKQLGGKSFFWRGVKDSRERKKHLNLEGARFLWDKPYEVDKNLKKIPGGRVKPGSSNNLNPGKDYRCRCHAEMDVEYVLE